MYLYKIILFLISNLEIAIIATHIEFYFKHISYNELYLALKIL